MMRQLIRASLVLLLGPQVVFYLGALLNQFAMAANGTVMPVLWNSMNKWSPDPRHVVMTQGTPLKVLCDWINLSYGILSPGDIFLDLGDMCISPAFWMWLTYVLYRAYLSYSVPPMPRSFGAPMPMRGVFGGIPNPAPLSRVYRA